jgi:putative PIN family toxin of toxin-antitoxin system
MKVVLDTNVLVAAFASHGLAHSLFELCLDRHTIIASEHIVTELDRTLTGKLKMPRPQAALVLDYIRHNCTMETPATLPRHTCRDVSDVPVLGLCIRARPACLVTGDHDLLDLKEIEGTPIITLREFWEKHGKTKSR